MLLPLVPGQPGRAHDVAHLACHAAQGGALGAPAKARPAPVKLRPEPVQNPDVIVARIDVISKVVDEYHQQRRPD